jgi:hypothetical protein
MFRIILSFILWHVKRLSRTSPLDKDSHTHTPKNHYLVYVWRYRVCLHYGAMRRASVMHMWIGCDSLQITTYRSYWFIYSSIPYDVVWREGFRISSPFEGKPELQDVNFNIFLVSQLKNSSPENTRSSAKTSASRFQNQHGNHLKTNLVWLNCIWSSPAQSFSVPDPSWFMNIYFFLTTEFLPNTLKIQVVSHRKHNSSPLQ